MNTNTNTKTENPKGVTLAKVGDLYCIPCGEGYTCLGFDVCIEWTRALCSEMNIQPPEQVRGTIEAYLAYDDVLATASRLHNRTGWRSRTQLTPQLIGLECKRVEVVDCYGETRRFWVGKSLGFIPVHLEIEKRTDDGGPAAMGTPYKSVKVIS